MKYQITKAASNLFSAGVRFYDYGEIRGPKGERLFDYYKTDGVTDSQKESLRAYCPDVQFKESRAQYAPEIRACLVCFPKAAFYRNLAAQK